MPRLDIPYRCIWCLKEKPPEGFDISHVVPECLGNDDQVLPAGLVCKKCNHYFGLEVEPRLLEFPLIHLTAVSLRIVDPGDLHVFRDKLFDEKHPPVGEITRKLDLKAQIDDTNTVFDILYSVQGQMAHTYTLNELSCISRGIHKIAFESLAYGIYVQNTNTQINLFSSLFDEVRKWTREGSPHQKVRPVICKIGNETKPLRTYEVWSYPNGIGVHVMLYRDWYGVNLTSHYEQASEDLKSWVGNNTHNSLCITDRIALLLP